MNAAIKVEFLSASGVCQKEEAGLLKQSRVLVVGHTYLLPIHQQKLDVISPRCGALGALVPRNWVSRNALFDRQPQPLKRGYDSFKFYQANVYRSGHVASYIFDPIQLVTVLKTSRPQLIHIEQEVYSVASAQLALAAKAHGQKVVVFGWENLDRKIHPLQVPARKAVLSLADAIVCGNSQGAELVRRWGFKGPVDVMPQLGVEPALFRRNRRTRADLFTIGFVGRLVNEKGVDILLKAVRLLAERDLRFRVKICGQGPCNEQLKRLAGDLGINDRTIWMSTVAHNQVPRVMRDLDVLVLPSRSVDWWSEQFGHVLIEAMAAGVVVVGSSCGAIPEVIGRKDLIFSEEDIDGLAAILERIINDQHRRKEIERYLLSRVHQRYTQREVARQLATVWEKVLQDGF